MNAFHYKQCRILAALVLAILAGACSAPDLTVYSGARLIVGDGCVIENATFTVADGRFHNVGATGEFRVPADAPMVDLTGTTVMPTLFDTHVHMSTSREALIEDLCQRAQQGVSAAMSLGSDGLDAPLELRGETIAGVARARAPDRRRYSYSINDTSLRFNICQRPSRLTMTSS